MSGRRHEIWLLLSVIAIAAVGALLLLGRRAPPRIAPPATASGVTVSEPTPSVEGLLVHVAGAVKAPGLYRFPPGARVADAIQTAGGALRAADLSALNLAEELVDGSKIEVPRRGDQQQPMAAAPSTAPTSIVIDLNTADQIALETIPGVGPVTALAILQHRDEIGGFESIDQLLDVDGIGPATLESIRPYVSL